MAQNFIITDDEWNIRTYTSSPPDLVYKITMGEVICGYGSGIVTVVGVRGKVTFSTALTYLVGKGFPCPPQHIIKEFIRLN